MYDEYRLKDLMTVKQAAQQRGVTTGRIRQMLRAGTLGGVKVGDVWLMPRKENNADRESEGYRNHHNR